MLDSVRKSKLALYRKRDIEKTIFHVLCSHSKCALDNDVCNILINVMYINLGGQFQSLYHVSCILVKLLTFISIHRNRKLFW